MYTFVVAFQRINEANDVVSDSYKRMLYEMEKRPIILAAQSRGAEMESFEKWYGKVRSTLVNTLCES